MFLVPSKIVFPIDVLPATYFKEGEEAKVHVLYEAMHPVLQALISISHQEFAKQNFWRFLCCHSFTGTHRNNKLKNKSKFIVKHG